MRMLAVAAVLASSGCAHRLSFRETRLGRELLTRASLDLGCPEEQLAIEELPPERAGAWGCSRHAMYVWEHESWILNPPGTGDPDTRSSEAR
jgi:hypothetical protein